MNVATIFILSVIFMPLSVDAGEVAQPYKPPGKFIMIESRHGYLHRMYIDCRGTREPTVLIDVGIGDSSANWLTVMENVSSKTRVCIYDRAGYGFSDSGPGPRTTKQIVEELNNLVVAAKIPEPYVLVGHSFGGFTAQYFAAKHQDKTVGLVLVDSSNPYQVERLSMLDGRTTRKPQRRIISRREPPAEDLSAVQKQWYWLNSSRKATFAIMDELKYFKESARQVQTMGIISPDLPLAVLTRDQSLLPEINGKSLEHEWLDMQKQLTRLSANSWQTIVENSGHNIYRDAPRRVSEHIIKVVMLADAGSKTN